MRTILGLLMVLAGIALGLYVGLWVMFIGGVVGIVEIIQSDSVTTGAVAWQVLRLVFASTIGGLSFYILAIPGLRLMSGKSLRSTRRFR